MQVNSVTVEKFHNNLQSRGYWKRLETTYSSLDNKNGVAGQKNFFRSSKNAVQTQGMKMYGSAISTTYFKTIIHF